MSVKVIRLIKLSLASTIVSLLVISPIVPAAVSAALTNTSLSATVASFSVKGNEVLLPDGRIFVPEGISIYGGLEDTDYMENTANLDAQIIASALYWHANTVRLQVSETNLFDHLKRGQTYNTQFLSELIREVKLARSYNLAVVINDQTEFTSNLPAPTKVTAKFWQVMGQTFGNWPYVIFDLFNEPRLTTANVNHVNLQKKGIRLLLHINQLNIPHHRHKTQHATPTSMWNYWKYGGKLGGISYVGMQNLVNQIRSAGYNNLVWVEGLSWGQSLPSGQYLLSGTNIVYSFHHVNLNRQSYWRFIGNLAAIRPVVDGEWSQYQSPWEECYSSAPLNAPKYLNYLKLHNVGLIAWSLQAGSLLKGRISITPANNNSPGDPIHPYQLKTPSSFSKNYQCNNHYGEGVGSLIKRYFNANAQPL